MVMMTDVTVESYLADPMVIGERLKAEWDIIPLLVDIPSHDLVDGQFLRFRGMVQDMPNPVFFYERYAVINTRTGQVSMRSGKFRDGLICKEDERLQLDSDGAVSSERRPFYCVTIPGLNAWAELKSKSMTIDPVAQTSTSGTKRPAEDMEVDQEGLVKTSSNTENKRPCVNLTGERPEQAGSGTINLHCPIPSSKDSACVIHIYDEKGDSLKVNDVVDVVGFVYVSQTDQDDIDVPPSLAPRLHVVAMKNLSTVNPQTSPIEEFPMTAPSIRSDLLLALTQLCLGDHFAAEYLLCHLLANVYMRQDLTVLGKFSLNLFNVPKSPSYTRGLYDILSSFLPTSHFFPMSLLNMNTTDLVPVKDYETNRLKSGLLQLSNRTHLVIDETQLEVGKLEERGVKNVQVFNTLLTEQAVHYDFKFYSVPFAANIPVLVLSEGKSLLQCDTQVRLTPDGSFNGVTIDETLNAIRSYLKEPLLSKIRNYLTTAAAQKDFKLPEDLTQKIQNDFVSMRQANNKLTPDEMHSHMVLARLLSLGLGQTELSATVWERASDLENTRRSRLS